MAMTYYTIVIAVFITAVVLMSIYFYCTGRRDDWCTDETDTMKS